MKCTNNAQWGIAYDLYYLANTWIVSDQPNMLQTKVFISLGSGLNERDTKKLNKPRDKRTFSFQWIRISEMLFRYFFVLLRLQYQ